MRSYRILTASLIALAISGNGVAAAATHYVPIVVPVATGPAAPPHNSGPPSLYLQCDGNPAIMGDMEKFARFMGAITLLGLLAPQPEVPEPGKRLFAEAGVAACSKLIDGADQPEHVSADTNPLRRVPLLLARAAHRIEAKDYAAAIADVHKARDEAAAAHLIGDPYFDRSMGLSFDQMESVALMLSGDGGAAREISLRHVRTMPYSFVGLIFANDYAWANPSGAPVEDAYIDARNRLSASAPILNANRLEMLGRLAEGAALREVGRSNLLEMRTDLASPAISARSAVSLAMTGQWELAQTRADEARKGIDDADAAGKPDPLKDQVIECLDFFQVLKLAHDGRIDDARRNFAARSEWSHVGIGAIWAETEILRKGARADQLFGALAASREQLQTALLQKGRAQLAQAATDNKMLFTRIVPYARIDEFERLSKPVWNTGKSAFMGDKPMANSHFWQLSMARIAAPWRMTWPDALLLHAALQAKARGFKGFVYSQESLQLGIADVLFGNAGDPAMPPQLYLDADAVIAELRQIIPSPAELAERRAKREKQAH